MSREIIWSPAALNDLTDILDYLNFKWSEKVATGFLDILDTCVNQISLNPALFQHSSNEFNVRKCVVTKQNTLYFSDESNTVILLRLYDTRQNPDNFRLF